MSGWYEDVARQGTEAIYDGIYWAHTHGACGDLTGCALCREQAERAWKQVAPFLAAEVARAEARGKVAALREAADAIRAAVGPVVPHEGGSAGVYTNAPNGDAMELWSYGNAVAYTGATIEVLGLIEDRAAAIEAEAGVCSARLRESDYPLGLDHVGPCERPAGHDLHHQAGSVAWPGEPTLVRVSLPEAEAGER